MWERLEGVAGILVFGLIVTAILWTVAKRTPTRWLRRFVQVSLVLVVGVVLAGAAMPLFGPAPSPSGGGGGYKKPVEVSLPRNGAEVMYLVFKDALAKRQGRELKTEPLSGEQELIYRSLAGADGAKPVGSTIMVRLQDRDGQGVDDVRVSFFPAASGGQPELISHQGLVFVPRSWVGPYAFLTWEGTTCFGIRIPDRASMVTLPLEKDPQEFAAGAAAEAAVLAELDAAQKTIRVLRYAFANAKIDEALLRAKKRGVDVEVILDPAQADAARSSKILLANSGVTVLVAGKKSYLVPRATLVDGRVAIPGSLDFKEPTGAGKSPKVFIHRRGPRVFLVELGEKCRADSVPLAEAPSGK